MDFITYEKFLPTKYFQITVIIVTTMYVFGLLRMYGASEIPQGKEVGWVVVSSTHGGFYWICKHYIVGCAYGSLRMCGASKIL